MDETDVILVDEADHPVGFAGKLEVHQKALLHRAFSVFIFNRNGEMLLQQRALNKYHSGGLWSNACCSHPAPGEETQFAARRRLREEMGIETTIEKVFDFIYKAELGNGLAEHEFDHVFTGQYDGKVDINKNEVLSCCYKAMSAIEQQITSVPEKFTVWFRIAFPQIKKWWEEQYNDKAG
jgi:isopentenyl-diphosphate delta-isomerase